MSFDLEKMRSIAVGRRTRDRVVEGKTEDGGRYKSTTDELNNTVTERSSGISGVSEGQDVTMRPQTVKGRMFG